MRLREGINVADELERSALLERRKRLRDEVQLDLNTYEYWNRLNPTEPPIDTTFERAVLAWYDGGCEGPFPSPETTAK